MRTLFIASAVIGLAGCDLLAPASHPQLDALRFVKPEFTATETVVLIATSEDGGGGATFVLQTAGRSLSADLVLASADCPDHQNLARNFWRKCSDEELFAWVGTTNGHAPAGR